MDRRHLSLGGQPGSPDQALPPAKLAEGIPSHPVDRVPQGRVAEPPQDGFKILRGTGYFLPVTCCKSPPALLHRPQDGLGYLRIHGRGVQVSISLKSSQIGRRGVPCGEPVELAAIVGPEIIDRDEVLNQRSGIHQSRTINHDFPGQVPHDPYTTIRGENTMGHGPGDDGPSEPVPIHTRSQPPSQALPDDPSGVLVVLVHGTNRTFQPLRDEVQHGGQHPCPDRGAHHISGGHGLHSCATIRQVDGTHRHQETFHRPSVGQLNLYDSGMLQGRGDMSSAQHRHLVA